MRPSAPAQEASGRAAFILGGESGPAIAVHMEIRARLIRLRIRSASRDALDWLSRNWESLSAEVSRGGYRMEIPECRLSDSITSL